MSGHQVKNKPARRWTSVTSRKQQDTVMCFCCWVWEEDEARKVNAEAPRFHTANSMIERKGEKSTNLCVTCMFSPLSVTQKSIHILIGLLKVCNLTVVGLPSASNGLHESSSCGCCFAFIPVSTCKILPLTPSEADVPWKSNLASGVCCFSLQW